MISAYALQNDRIVSIVEVVNRSVASRDFRCPCCAGEMLTVMGKVRRPHFRHHHLGATPERPCSAEGVMHATAKAVISAGVVAAIAAGTSYEITLAAEIDCPERARVLTGRCRHRIARRSVDLAQLGPPQIEAQIGGYRYDMLFSDPDGRQIAIEIAVSAPVAPEKWKAGIPVVEIGVSSEEAIERLVTGIDEASLRLRTQGLDDFVGPPLAQCAGEACASRCLSFSVMRSGRVSLEELAPFEACGTTISRAHHVVLASEQAFALSRFEALDRLTRQAFFVHRAPVRSCLVCRHHDLTDPGSGAAAPVRCRLDGQEDSLNRGASCPYFSPFATIDEVREFRLTRRQGEVFE